MTMTMTITPSPPPILFLSPTIITGDETNPPFIADVLVQDGLISRIAPDISAPEARTVDARGHVLCPGFIDMHAHSDLYLLTHPEHEAKISQGCTVSRRGGPGHLHLDGGVLECWNVGAK
jgi:N-acyl-D-amino-acid deacylase